MKHTQTEIAQILGPWRKRIDAMDREIVALLAERMRLIHEVGALKAREDIPAILPDRVKEVVGNAVACAQKEGLDPVLAEELYTILVDYSCRMEDAIKQDMAAKARLAS